MRMHVKPIVLAGLAAMALSACERRDTPPTSSGSPSSSERTPPTAKTPMDQSQSADDIRITADIRRAILGDKSLSLAAQNCTVITDKGVVTLRGQVDTAAEKEAIASKASAVAGVSRVDNQLEVKPK